MDSLHSYWGKHRKKSPSIIQNVIEHLFDIIFNKFMQYSCAFSIILDTNIQVLSLSLKQNGLFVILKDCFGKRFIDEGSNIQREIICHIVVFCNEVFGSLSILSTIYGSCWHFPVETISHVCLSTQIVFLSFFETEFACPYCLALTTPYRCWTEEKQRKTLSTVLPWDRAVEAFIFG